MPVIQIFAKPPVEGRVKTRLIPDIGAVKAVEVFRYCLNYTLNMVSSCNIDHHIWLSEVSKEAIFQRPPCFIQQGSDLGARMLFALQSQIPLEADNKVVLIGSDCLDINQDHFDQAFAALATNDIVLLPTFDGGFALIGCRIIDPLLFDDVEWSSGGVLQQTIINAKRLNYQVHLLEMVRDIDTLSDLGHYPDLLSIIEQN